MRVLLDENLDWRLKRSFDPSFDVTTVRDRGLAGVTNGALLRAAAIDFDVFVTLDRNLQYQHHIAGMDIAIVVIRTVHSRRSQIEPMMTRVNNAVAEAVPCGSHLKAIHKVELCGRFGVAQPVKLPYVIGP